MARFVRTSGGGYVDIDRCIAVAPNTTGIGPLELPEPD